jgi:hypothetical protein
MQFAACNVGRGACGVGRAAWGVHRQSKKKIPHKHVYNTHTRKRRHTSQTHPLFPFLFPLPFPSLFPLFLFLSLLHFFLLLLFLSFILHLPLPQPLSLPCLSPRPYTHPRICAYSMHRCGRGGGTSVPAYRCASKYVRPSPALTSALGPGPVSPRVPSPSPCACVWEEETRTVSHPSASASTSTSASPWPPPPSPVPPTTGENSGRPKVE